MVTVPPFVQRWGMWLAPEPVEEGVYKRRGGGFVIRGRVVCTRTGRTVTICRALAGEKSAKRAYVILQDLKEQARRGVLDAEPGWTMPTWRSFAASLFKAKVEDGSIASAKGREKWLTVLTHLSCAKWADYLLDRIEGRDLHEWRDSLPSLTWTRTRVDKKTGQSVVIKTGRYASSTLNDWLAVARVVFIAAKRKYALPVDPMADVEDFPLKGHRTYTKEEPNALTPEETAAWLAKFREMYPRLFALVLLGFVLGQRPSTLRPLRRRGKHADLDLARGVIQLRRSHTLGDEVMEATKTFADQEVALPKSVLDVLREHVAWLDAGYPDGGTWQQRKSDLLFPSAEGKLLCRSALQKPFANGHRGVRAGQAHHAARDAPDVPGPHAQGRRRRRRRHGDLGPRHGRDARPILDGGHSGGRGGDRQGREHRDREAEGGEAPGAAGGVELVSRPSRRSHGAHAPWFRTAHEANRGVGRRVPA